METNNIGPRFDGGPNNSVGEDATPPENFAERLKEADGLSWSGGARASNPAVEPSVPSSGSLAGRREVCAFSLARALRSPSGRTGA